MKKLLLVIGVILIFTLNSVAQTTPEIKNLRTEYLRNPIGIDVKIPQFSWEFHSGKRGAKQSAYEITVSTDKQGAHPIWNTGKVISGQSVNNACASIALAPSTRYFWYVQVWDNKNSKLTSTETAFFETGLLDSGWGNAKWIRASTLKRSDTQHTIKDIDTVTDYTIKLDFQINDIAAGPCFGAKDANNFFMWQINIEEGKARLRPHSWVNGKAVCHVNKDISSRIAIKKGVTYALRIEIKGNKASTYINNILVDADRVNPDGGNYGFAGLGFRAAKAESSDAMESAFYDNIVVTKYLPAKIKGMKVPVVAFSENFENSSNPFVEGETVSFEGNTRLEISAKGTEIRVMQGLSNGTPMFRSTFKVTKTIQSARIYSSALGVYDLFLNGNRVGTATEDGKVVYDELKPGWTDYTKTAQYSTYDVTHLLHPGANAVGACVASGWWKGDIAHGEYGNPDLCLIARLFIQYTDGTSQTIVTDPSWSASTSGPVRMADIYNGETYDARKESDWRNAGFDDSAWLKTDIYTGFKGKLKAFVGPSVQVRAELTRQPISITVYKGNKANDQTFGAINTRNIINGKGLVSLKAGETALYDFGQNMVGWVKFTAKSQEGSRMKLRFGEMLNDNGALTRGNDGPAGSLYTANLRGAKATLNYTFKGSIEGETYHPGLTFFGFRYCEVTATRDVEIQSMMGQVVGSANEEGSSFKTNSDLVNKLYQNVIWGQRSNFLSIPTDCPQRDERLGWTGDTQIFSKAAAYNADVASFFHKWMGDMRDSQRNDGAYPSTAPHSWVGYGQGAWAEAGIIVTWNIYLMYNDPRMITENYESMEKYMGFLAAQKGDGYLYNGAGIDYGDWVAYENMDKRYVSVCYYAYAAQLMMKMSEALSHKTEDFYDLKRASYRKLYDNIKTEFQTRYVNHDGSLKEVSQTAYLLALKLELFPNDIAKNNGITFLTQKIATNGNKLSTGFIGTGILNQTLSQFGATNTAYNLLLQRENPSWLYSVDQGATTIWERWDSYTLKKGFQDVSMNSFNHYSYGAVSEWMYRYMAGIEADESVPGFKHIILQPMPDSRTSIPEGQERITTVDASYKSVYGVIRSAWIIRKDGNLSYQTTIPANTTATLYLPLPANSGIVYEGKVLANKSEGVTFVKKENGKAVYNLQSGSYSFGVNVPSPSDKNDPVNNILK
ncbi:MAG: family 78 glycoside hydrolase catalytic domain [Paludibacter sp.]|nr:family 78 glycoside hydrolase catalytic domain [Paludibacter sp.]